MLLKVREKYIKVREGYKKISIAGGNYAAYTCLWFLSGVALLTLSAVVFPSKLFLSLYFLLLACICFLFGAWEQDIGQDTWLESRETSST